MKTNKEVIWNAINFIVQNPYQEKYVNENFSKFLTNGEYDDDSIQLNDKWKENYKIMITFITESINLANK